ncbi:MAG: hypothetical protein ACKVU2_12450 [Saprospiraceae bacterium]
MKIRLPTDPSNTLKNRTYPLTPAHPRFLSETHERTANRHTFAPGPKNM